MRDEFELPETFDPSSHEGTGAPPPIPIGWHSAQIIESAVRDASTGNGTYLLAVFEVLEGEHRGRKIFQNVTLQNSSQQAVDIGTRLLTDIFTSVGHTGPTRDIRVMLFKPVMVRVGIKRDKDGIYPDRNAVTAGETSGLSAQARTPQRSAAGGAQVATGPARRAGIATDIGGTGNAGNSRRQRSVALTVITADGRCRGRPFSSQGFPLWNYDRIRSNLCNCCSLIGAPAAAIRCWPRRRARGNLSSSGF